MSRQSISRRRFISTTATVAAATFAVPHFIRAQSTSKRKLILIAGKPSHPPGQHEFNAGCTVLSDCLKDHPDLDVSVHKNHWVSDNAVLDTADALLIYSDGGGGNPAIQGNHKELIAKQIARGMGIMFAHYGVEVPKDNGGKEFQDWIGGYYEDRYSVNPMWDPDFTTFPEHPITRGVKPFHALKDEWYFNIRFRPDMAGITPLLTAKPSDQTRDGPYVSPRGPYPHIQADKGKTETMMWAIERPDGGRGVGFTGGHTHAHWADENQRKVVLNALVWISKLDVPKDGVQSKLPEGELVKNLDPKGRRGG